MTNLMRPVLTLTVLLAAGLNSFGAQQPKHDNLYCAFHVVVKSQTGTPLPRVQVGIVLDGRQISDTMTDSAGLATLCDVPLKEVDIVAGNSRCGHTVVRNVRARWPKTAHIAMTYSTNQLEAGCAGPEFPNALKTDCDVLLRVSDLGEKRIAGVQLRRAVGAVVARSDALGRLFLLLNRGERVVGELAAPGFLTQPVSIVCDPDSSPFIEQVFTLTKR